MVVGGLRDGRDGHVAGLTRVKLEAKHLTALEQVDAIHFLALLPQVSDLQDADKAEVRQAAPVSNRVER